MVQIVFDFILLTRSWEYAPRLRPQIRFAVRTAAQFQGYEVIKFVIADAPCNPVNPYEVVFHRIGVVEGGSNGRRVAWPTDRISDVALRNSRIDCSWRQVVTRQRSRWQVRLRWPDLEVIIGNASKMVQRFSIVRRMHTPKILA
jgi:hypothetical protein